MSFIYSGTFSVVRVGINKKTSEKVAIKVIDKKTLGDKTDMIQSEVEILKRITHPNIVELKEMFETSSVIYLVMELYVFLRVHAHFYLR